MNGVELLLGTIIGLVFLAIAISILTFIIIGKYDRNIKEMKNIYLGKLENSDSSIQNAIHYLKLTNGIIQQNGEKE